MYAALRMVEASRQRMQVPGGRGTNCEDRKWSLCGGRLGRMPLVRHLALTCQVAVGSGERGR